MSKINREIVFIGENEYLRNVLEQRDYKITKVITDTDDIANENYKKNIFVINNKDIIKNVKYQDMAAIFCINNHAEVCESCENYNCDMCDYVLKPVDSNDLINRIEKLIKMEKVKSDFDEAEKKNERLVEMLYEVNKINKKLMVKAQDLEDEISLDPIANVYNKKYTLKRLEEEIARVIRYDRKFAVVMVDVKNIKEVNDLYGHVAGDETINKIARILSDNVRTSDIVGRIRGNTFVIILPEILEKYSLMVIERIVQSISQMHIKEVKLDAFAGFVIATKDFCKEYSKNEDILTILDKLIIFGKQAGMKIVEYNDESYENVGKVKDYVIKNEIEEKHNVILEELAKSKKFIERLLPRTEEWGERIDYNYLYYPFNFIGGDFFDFTIIDDDKTAVLFCDVSGHGVSSALYITAIKYIFKSLINKDKIHEPAKFLEEFNKSIIELAEQNIFVATTFGIIDRKEKSFTYSYGGGTVPIKIDCKTHEIEKLAESGYIIGIFEDATFEEKKVFLNSGDVLFFYSDGIYEFLIENEMMEDDSGFIDVVKKTIAEGLDENIVNRIYAKIQDKIDEKSDFNDDITVLSIKI